ncbi:MAG: hypothetical protein ABIZ05_01625 [Pseudonocardiaceae bacterium]
MSAAARPRINIFVPTSEPQQRANQMSAADAVRRAPLAVAEARKLVDDIQFSCGDAYRADLDYLVVMVDSVVRAGRPRSPWWISAVGPFRAT